MQVLLAQLSRDENRDNVNDLLLKLRLDTDEEVTRGLQFNIDTVDSLKWTIIKTVLTLMFSALGILLIHYISDFSLFLKHTRNEGSTITKIALFQLINSFLVPVLAFVAFGRDTSRLWCVGSRIDGEIPNI